MAIDLVKLGVTEKEVTTLINREKARKEREKRNWMKQRLLMKKAKAAGITVTEEEIDAELAKK